MLEYVKHMVKVDDIHFLKVTNKGIFSFLVTMGGCALNDKNVVKEAPKILKGIDLAL